MPHLGWPGNPQTWSARAPGYNSSEDPGPSLPSRHPRGVWREQGAVGKAEPEGSILQDGTRSGSRTARETYIPTKVRTRTGQRRLSGQKPHSQACRGTGTTAKSMEARSLLCPSPPPPCTLPSPLYLTRLPCPWAPRIIAETAHGGSDGPLQLPRRKTLSGPPRVTHLPPVPPAMARNTLKKARGGASFLLRVACRCDLGTGSWGSTGGAPG